MGGPDDDMIEVANPHYTALKSLYDDVEAARPTLAKALNTPASLMQDGSAWTGPTTATTFKQDVTERDRSLPGHVDKILDAIDTEMRNTAKTVKRPRKPYPIPR